MTKIAHCSIYFICFRIFLFISIRVFITIYFTHIFCAGAQDWRVHDNHEKYLHMAMPLQTLESHFGNLHAPFDCSVAHWVAVLVHRSATTMLPMVNAFVIRCTRNIFRNFALHSRNSHAGRVRIPTS